MRKNLWCNLLGRGMTAAQWGRTAHALGSLKLTDKIIRARIRDGNTPDVAILAPKTKKPRVKRITRGKCLFCGETVPVTAPYARWHLTCYNKYRFRGWRNGDDPKDSPAKMRYRKIPLTPHEIELKIRGMRRAWGV